MTRKSKRNKHGHKVHAYNSDDLEGGGYDGEETTSSMHSHGKQRATPTSKHAHGDSKHGDKHMKHGDHGGSADSYRDHKKHQSPKVGKSPAGTPSAKKGPQKPPGNKPGGPTFHDFKKSFGDKPQQQQQEQPLDQAHGVFELPDDPEAAKICKEIHKELTAALKSSMDERKKVFRTLTMKHHPDKGGLSECFAFLNNHKDNFLSEHPKLLPYK